MKLFFIQLLVIAGMGVSFLQAKIRTIKNFRELKNSNMNRLHGTRKLTETDINGNPLIYSIEKLEFGEGENNHHFMALSYEIAKKTANIKHLGNYVDSVQDKIDYLSESVVERINVINNLVNSQFLGADGI